MKYHTGIDMKAVQDLRPASEPHGKLSNRPVAVDDDLQSIIRAMGGDPKVLDGINISAHRSSVPIKEF